MNIENLLTQLLILKGLTEQQRQKILEIGEIELKGLTEQQRQKILEIGEIEQYQYGEHIFE